MESNIVWSATALREAGRVLEFIRQDSVSNADKVYNKIINRLETVAISPESCPPDKYKVFNDGSYRAFLVYRYRVSYRIMVDGIIVLRIRHSSMKPKFY